MLNNGISTTSRQMGSASPAFLIRPFGAPSPRGKEYTISNTLYLTHMERNPKLKILARNLRKNPTKEEGLLWHNFLRIYPMQFRRQYIIGNYIVDFYCHEARLVVELDGSQHYEEKGQQQDAERTTYLESQGLFVLRFSNLDVTQSFREVCEVIDRIAQQRRSAPASHTKDTVHQLNDTHNLGTS